MVGAHCGMSENVALRGGVGVRYWWSMTRVETVGYHITESRIATINYS